MAKVFPFRAFRYNPAHAPFEHVLPQPYDKISPEMQDKYYAADPHNLITVEKGRVLSTDTPQNNVYTRADAAPPASVLLASANGRNTPPVSFSATNILFPAPKPTASSFCATPVPRPANSLCFIPTLKKGLT